MDNLLGKPDVIPDMKYGGTRYKYLHGIMIDHVASTGVYHVAQAASPKSVKIGEARSLAEAEALALARADLPTDPYKIVRAQAQAAANADGFDRGIEKLGGTWRYFMLPQARNRYGHELSCEVVSCEDLSRCATGHGPCAKAGG